MTQRSSAQELRRARYRRACWWLNQGVEVVPIRPRSKKLYKGYGPRKARITSANGARRWFLSTDANLGVVLGGGMGLIVADWDTVRDYRDWRYGVGSRVATLSERTGRGYHLFFFGEDLPPAAGNGCEFKVYGICTVSPSVHPSGALYRIVTDAPIVRIDERTAGEFFPFLSEALREKERRALLAGSAGGVYRDRKTEESMSGGVVARIKVARCVVEEMQAAGVELRPVGSNTLVGLCPFHDDHSPSLWVYPDSGLWGCNKPSCSAAGIHDVINFRARARGISNREAIKQLADEFL